VEGVWEAQRRGSPPHRLRPVRCQAPGREKIHGWLLRGFFLPDHEPPGRPARQPDCTTPLADSRSTIPAGSTVRAGPRAPASLALRRGLEAPPSAELQEDDRPRMREVASKSSAVSSCPPAREPEPSGPAVEWSADGADPFSADAALLASPEGGGTVAPAASARRASRLARRRALKACSCSRHPEFGSAPPASRQGCRVAAAVAQRRTASSPVEQVQRVAGMAAYAEADVHSPEKQGRNPSARGAEVAAARVGVEDRI